jgi:hypothetical protein
LIGDGYSGRFADILMLKGRMKKWQHIQWPNYGRNFKKKAFLRNLLLNLG